MAPIYATAGIAYRRLSEWLRQANLPDGAVTYRESQQRLCLGNGAELWFKGSDNVDSLYGEDVRAAVVDEGSRCQESAWWALRSTLTATGGRAKIIGNVLEANYGQSWMCRLAKQARTGGPEMAYYKLTALDAIAAGIFPESELADAKRRLKA